MVIALAFIGGFGFQAKANNDLREIAAVEASLPKVVPQSHCVEITVFEEGNHEAAVYALTGQLVKHAVLQEGTTHIELAPGYYIVRIDGHSARVVVK